MIRTETGFATQGDAQERALETSQPYSNVWPAGNGSWNLDIEGGRS